MGFDDDGDLKFALYVVITVVVAFFLVYIVTSLVKDPYAKCLDYCEGKNDKLASVQNKEWPVECGCSKDIRDNFNNRPDLQRR